MNTPVTARSVSGHTSATRYIKWIEAIAETDLEIVGRANLDRAKLSRLAAEADIPVPQGFVITTKGFERFYRDPSVNQFLELRFKRIKQNPHSIGRISREIADTLRRAPLPPDLAHEIRDAYAELCRISDDAQPDVVIHSHPIGENLSDLSDPGHHPTEFKLSNPEDVICAFKRCIASLFTPQAIAWRKQNSGHEFPAAISVTVTSMVHADDGVAGKLTTMDPDTGFDRVVVIDSAYGIGELVVNGLVCPDEFRVFKPFLGMAGKSPVFEKRLGEKKLHDICSMDPDHPLCALPTTNNKKCTMSLGDAAITELAALACRLEKVYGHALDIEWAQDARTDRFFFVKAGKAELPDAPSRDCIISYSPDTGERQCLAKGVGITHTIVSGRARIIPEDGGGGIVQFRPGEILVTGQLTPGHLPYLWKAAGVVTDKGGRTSYAARICREMKLPAVIGTRCGSLAVPDGAEISLDCSHGEMAEVIGGQIGFSKTVVSLSEILPTHTRHLLAIRRPDQHGMWRNLPSQGIGSAPMESIICEDIGIHPMALVHYAELTDADIRGHVDSLTGDVDDRKAFFVDRLSEGLARMAASCHPAPVTFRLSDFSKTDPSSLVGFDLFEPHAQSSRDESRGPRRYLGSAYAAAFAWECEAIRKARETMGFENIHLAVPCCRTPDEAVLILKKLEENGLREGEQGLQVSLVAELTSNALLAHEFAEIFDSIHLDLDALTRSVLGYEDRLSIDSCNCDYAVMAAVSSIVKGALISGKRVTVFGLRKDSPDNLIEFMVRSGVHAFAHEPEDFAPLVRKTHNAEKKDLNHHAVNPNGR